MFLEIGHEKAEADEDHDMNILVRGIGLVELALWLIEFGLLGAVVEDSRFPEGRLSPEKTQEDGFDDEEENSKIVCTWHNYSLNIFEKKLIKFYF